MTDVLTKKQRSYNMSQIRGKNTKPELKMRKLLFLKGIRGYRISSDIPGKPDIYFPRYKIAIFIDGCYWHKCPKCFIKPQTNENFWMRKIDGNVKRDKKINDLLSDEGWKVIRFWEHEIKNNIEKCVQNIIKQLKWRGYKIETS